MKGAISTVSTYQALAAATTADEVLEAHGNLFFLGRYWRVRGGEEFFFGGRGMIQYNIHCLPTAHEFESTSQGFKPILAGLVWGILSQVSFSLVKDMK